MVTIKFKARNCSLLKRSERAVLTARLKTSVNALSQNFKMSVRNTLWTIGGNIRIKNIPLLSWLKHGASA